MSDKSDPAETVPTRAVETRSLALTYLGRPRETIKALKSRIAVDAKARAEAWADHGQLDLIRTQDPHFVGGTQGDRARVTVAFVADPIVPRGSIPL